MSPDKRPRDSQRIRVYRAHWALDDHLKAKSLGSVDEVQAFVDSVVQSRWWRERVGGRARIRVGDGRGRRSAGSIGGEIRIPRASRTVPTVLHELAHEAVRDPSTAIHGPEYAAAFLQLVEGFIGHEAGAYLRMAYLAQGVRWIEGWTGNPRSRP
ncbi:MAG: hypothetical protein A2Z12_06170 [Actinobacteria bacterium RBG_16_68_21]|nr:MAG: hypothetical protein A2Z12_06170 [Actinobacteria bacterium RBG_16_68_21]